LGHRAILDEARRAAKRAGWTPIALTFDRHPLETLAPGKKPPLLTTLQRRIDLILESGIAHVVVVRFTGELASTEPESFVDEILLGALGARAMIVGFDFKFGRGAGGNTATLEAWAEEKRFDLLVVPPVTHVGEVLSSTKIRALLQSGEVEAAASFLGRAYALDAHVESVDPPSERGATTLRVRADERLLVPGAGVYQTTIDGRLSAVTTIGPRVADGERTGAAGAQSLIECRLQEGDESPGTGPVRIDFHRRLSGLNGLGGENLVKENPLQ